MHGLHLPEWTLTALVALLAAGFPATLALSWAFDLTADGIRRRRLAPVRPRLGLLLGALGVVAAAPGLVYFFLWPGAARGRVAALARAAPSIAVLPFADMSPAKDQELLSDGIAEEILDGLSPRRFPSSRTASGTTRPSRSSRSTPGGGSPTRPSTGSTGPSPSATGGWGCCAGRRSSAPSAAIRATRPCSPGSDCPAEPTAGTPSP